MTVMREEGSGGKDDSRARPDRQVERQDPADEVDQAHLGGQPHDQTDHPLLIGCQ